MSSRTDDGDNKTDLSSAPPETPWGYLRRRWRSAGQHRGLEFWLLFRGFPFVVLYALLFLLNGVLIGWRKSYDVSIAITSPADTAHPVAAWLLSMAGWLVAPGIAGAIAGYVLSASINSRRKTSAAALYAEDRDE
ncbi:DUF6313 family protein [Actinoplanes sp. NBC_00393]|uniref:DUF6313 family protein n=1 Tax=Actinoplanes sp. NBC_00393 TaxID=2975953 RepID=UPI002E1F8B2E